MHGRGVNRIPSAAGLASRHRNANLFATISNADSEKRLNRGPAARKSGSEAHKGGEAPAVIPFKPTYKFPYSFTSVKRGCAGFR